ncbi:MAG: polyhydroxyalkanoic acid system family protein [Hahellaceae bacterium]|nr:polyhydroxyalkanoic acid system family protein [Hahellaceae bacterium]
MSVIEVSRPHNLDKSHAVKAADDLAKSLSDQFSVHYSWEGEQLHFKRSGVKGQLEVNPNTIHVRIELGLLLRPFKDRIEQEIHKHLDHLTGA